MREPVSISDLPPVPWVREHDVDLLLAELLATEPSLTSWLLDRDLRRPAEIPAGTPSTVRAIVNYSRPHAPTEGAGETDVVVQADYPDGAGTLLLSIEDKVWAAPQRDQGEHHRAFVEGRTSHWGLAVLIGPKELVTGRPDEAVEYHLCVHLEDVAVVPPPRLRAPGICLPTGVRTTGLRACAGTAGLAHRRGQLVRRGVGFGPAPQRFVRTKNQGQAKSNRWVECEMDTLTSVRGAEQPSIIMKPASANHPSRATIEVPKATTPLVEHLSTRATERGFTVRVTRSGTLVIVKHVPEATRWSVAATFDEQIVHLRAIGRAAIALHNWSNRMVVELHLAPI